MRIVPCQQRLFSWRTHGKEPLLAGNENRDHAALMSSSESSFNSVSPDMALEQTVNRDSKIKRGIVGVTGMEGTEVRWALTAHMMAVATTSLRVVSGTHSRLKLP